MAEDKKVAKKSSTKKPAKKTAAKKKTAKKAATKKTAAKTATAKKAAPKTQRAPLISKTYQAKPGEIKPNWRLVDATNKTLGRLSAQIATMLTGKDKPTYTPHTDTGDFVVVINAEKVKMTGKKLTDKWYHYHTGYPGGVKSFTPQNLLEKHPQRIVERAVWGMLPSGHMGRKWMGKLKVYAGENHPHTAQKPQPVELKA